MGSPRWSGSMVSSPERGIGGFVPAERVFGDSQIKQEVGKARGGRGSRTRQFVEHTAHGVGSSPMVEADQQIERATRPDPGSSPSCRTPPLGHPEISISAVARGMNSRCGGCPRIDLRDLVTSLDLIADVRLRGGIHQHPGLGRRGDAYPAQENEDRNEAYDPATASDDEQSRKYLPAPGPRGPTAEEPQSAHVTPGARLGIGRRSCSSAIGS